jgi:hypothetical protein
LHEDSRIRSNELQRQGVWSAGFFLLDDLRNIFGSVGNVFRRCVSHAHSEGSKLGTVYRLVDYEFVVLDVLNGRANFFKFSPRISITSPLTILI